MLVETHSWKPYAVRVRATYNAIAGIVDYAARTDAHWSDLTTAADARAAALGGKSVAITYANTDHVTMLDYRGYAYTRDKSAVSGALVTKYDPTHPQIWHIPLKDQVHPDLTTTAPRGGYIVPAAHAAWMRDKLALHGIASQVVRTAAPGAAVEAFRAMRAKWAEAVTQLGSHLMPPKDRPQPTPAEVSAFTDWVVAQTRKAELAGREKSPTVRRDRCRRSRPLAWPVPAHTDRR